MFQVGERVRLLSQIGDYPTGTPAIVAAIVNGHFCEIVVGEVGQVKRLLIDRSAIALDESSQRLADPS
jgi:hypothetical protein